MLIYEKKVDTGRHLFGTLDTIPSALDDQLIYKDNDGNVLTPIANDTYRDNSRGGIIRESDLKDVNVFIGTKCIIGDLKEKYLVKIETAGNPKKTYIAGETLDLTGLIVNAVYSNGDVEAVTGYTTVPATGAVLTTDIDRVTVTYQNEVAEYRITVTTKTVDHLVWTKEPTLAYTLNDAINIYKGRETSDYIVTAIYNDASSVVVTKDCDYITHDGKTKVTLASTTTVTNGMNNKAVIASYEGKSVSTTAKIAVTV